MISIQNYQPKYWEKFVELMIAQMEYHLSIAKTEYFTGYSQEMMENYCREIIGRSNSSEAELLLAIGDNDDVAGFISWYVKKFDYFDRDFVKKVAIFDEMFIKSEYRGQGLATLLINSAEEHAKKVGVQLITLDDVHVDNQPAINLYNKLGYIPRVIEFSKEI